MPIVYSKSSATGAALALSSEFDLNVLVLPVGFVPVAVALALRKASLRRENPKRPAHECVTRCGGDAPERMSSQATTQNEKLQDSRASDH